MVISLLCLKTYSHKKETNKCRQSVEMKSSSFKPAERGKWWPSSIEARSPPMAACCCSNKSRRSGRSSSSLRPASLITETRIRSSTVWKIWSPSEFTGWRSDTKTSMITICCGGIRSWPQPSARLIQRGNSGDTWLIAATAWPARARSIAWSCVRTIRPRMAATKISLRMRRKRMIFFIDIFVQAQEEAPRLIVIDLDATDDPLHGAQEGRFYHGYYREYCYLPLYLFCGDFLPCALADGGQTTCQLGAR